MIDSKMREREREREIERERAAGWGERLDDCILIRVSGMEESKKMFGKIMELI